MENNKENLIKNVMSAVFGLPIEHINKDSSPETIENWDSLSHMNLIVGLEEEFKIEFSENEMFEMINYEIIEKIITKKL